MYKIELNFSEAIIRVNENELNSPIKSQILKLYVRNYTHTKPNGMLFMREIQGKNKDRES